MVWSEAGGQSHLDLLPWTVKLGLSVAAAYGVVRATMAAVAGERAWNSHTVRWLGLTLAVLFACGWATYYAHMNLEDADDEEQQDTTISRVRAPGDFGEAVLVTDARTNVGLPKGRAA